MEEAQTWRELLGKVISNSHERQRIAEVLSINPVTLTRWVTNKSKPRPENLRALLTTLPQCRQQLAALIKKEYPDLFGIPAIEEVNREIPSTFYTRVLNAYTNIPPLLRGSTICTLILQQMLGHLDPDLAGLAVFVAQCVSPLQGHKVRSLRRTFGRGTQPWGCYMDNQTQFFGAESAIGNALGQGHHILIQDYATVAALCPLLSPATTLSALAIPILQSSHSAGCLCVISTQSASYLQHCINLIHTYVDLIVLSFEPSELYELNDIDLGIMPSYTLQQPELTRFSQRVTQHMLQHCPITRPQAEQRVWRDLEEEFLKFPPDPKP